MHNMIRVVFVSAVLAGISGCGTGEVLDPPACVAEGTCPMVLDFQGVWTNPNPHSKVPAGAARRAENLVNPRPGVAECVPGQEALSGAYEEGSERLSSAVNYNGSLIEHTTFNGSLYSRDLSSGELTQLVATDFHAPEGVERMPFAEAGEKLYLGTDRGLRMLDGATGDLHPVGMARPIDADAALVTSTGAYPLSPGESVAYRTELRRRDAAGADIISAPSGRVVAVNTLTAVAAIGSVTLAGSPGDLTVVVGGHSVGPVAYTTSNIQLAADMAMALTADANVSALVTASSVGGIISLRAKTPGSAGNSISLSASRTANSATASGAFLAGGDDKIREVSLVNQLPDVVVAGDRLLTYRSSLSPVGIAPGDTLYLVHEHIITSDDVSAMFVTVYDVTPDALRGAPLYTNATSEGILRENARPPMARVMTSFDDALLLGDVTGFESFSFRLIAIPDYTDVLTIGGEAYATGLASDFPNGIWEPYVSGTVSENIAITAQRLVHAINQKTTNTSIYAYYASSETDPPGIIQILARTVDVPSFTIQTNANGDRYEPPLDDLQSSSATTEPNGIWVSKRGQHYAFPPLRSASATYRFRVGVRGNPILAMAPLRDAIIVFVQNEGVFRVKRTGNESWRVDQINNNAHLLVPGSVAVVDNQVVALTTRGIVAVDETGVEEIDLPIKDQIDDLKQLSLSVTQPFTFAVADEARLRYILYHPSSNTSTSADHAWIYNADNGTWTERTDPSAGGIVGTEDGLLYLGSSTSNTLTRERTGDDDAVYQRPDGSPIPVRLEWVVKDAGDPGTEKQFTEIRLLTDGPITGDVDFTFTNDLGGQESTTGTATGEPFIRVWVPDGTQRTTRLGVDIQREVLGEAFSIVGMKVLLGGMYDGAMTR